MPVFPLCLKEDASFLFLYFSLGHASVPLLFVFLHACWQQAHCMELNSPSLSHSSLQRGSSCHCLIGPNLNQSHCGAYVSWQPKFGVSIKSKRHIDKEGGTQQMIYTTLEQIVKLGWVFRRAALWKCFGLLGQPTAGCPYQLRDRINLFPFLRYIFLATWC